MDRLTITASSQNFYLAKRYTLMAMTMTALTVNANTGTLGQSSTQSGNILVYSNDTSVTPILQDKTYFFSKKKNFRERYKRISQSKWFKNTYNGKTLGEIMTVEE